MASSSPRYGYLKKLIEEANTAEDTRRLLQFCCWENPQFSHAVLYELLWQIAFAYTYELRPYLDQTRPSTTSLGPTKTKLDFPWPTPSCSRTSLITLTSPCSYSGRTLQSLKTILSYIKVIFGRFTICIKRYVKDP